MLVRSGDRTRLPVLAKAIAAAPGQDRQLVLNTLWSIDDPSIVDAVRGYLTADANGPLLVSALQQLRQLEKGRTAPTTAAVRALLDSRQPDLRTAALAWLCGGDGNEAFVAELVALLREDGNRFWQVERLFERDHKYPPALTDVFAAALASPRSQYDVTQVSGLLKTQAPELLAPALRQLLAHGNDDIRTAAMQALAAVPGGLASKDLQQMLHDGSAEQRLAAAAVLRRMDDPQGLPVVLELAKQPGRHLAETMRVLGGFRCREVVEPLLFALDDGNLQVRQNAWNGLQQVLRDLFPYRRFDFAQAGYDPNGTARTAGIQTLRAWWATMR
jgi:HEAT repeat protein